MRKSVRGCFLSPGRWVPILAWAAAVMLLLPGCGTKGTDLVPVRGRVTYGGGPWPKPGTLVFTNSERPGQAEFNTDGSFQAGAFKKGDGLKPGKYKVGVQCWEVPPSIERPGAEKSYVPSKYMNAGTSGLEITVEPGKPITDLKFEVPKK